MLNIHIDNPELEQSIRQTYGEDTKSIANAFFEFIQQQKIKQDIGVSIEQLKAGEGIPLDTAMREIRSKYE
ncbi:hypothetical protein MNBD_GAMMA21-866 [hydrothermal vent metagenome]|uniref:RelB/StbD replicon stabilization protein (Antitoxin to RelE/StbE) n=1 Tax=hydrothermal vent metagenome TaxID=652676 RepID=A0A3B0ZZL6_9ZZZZ